VPMHLPALAIRTAVVATSAAAAAIVSVVPASPAEAAPAGPPAAAPVAVAVTPVAKITPAAPPVLAQGAKASSALNHAMSKIGSPYRWGAAGPNAFDCSGLVSWAYRQAGVSLPRTSRAMSTVGKPVSKSDLRPGDLVFFYKPVSHVAIYIGGGKVVHASTKSSPVKISGMGGMPFNSARRI
jgi:cell wall-associated NlpC family hydrolase